MDVVLSQVQLDDELVRASEMQPYVPFTDPLAARRGFARAVQVSNYLRGVKAGNFNVNVADSAFRSADGKRDIRVRVYKPEDRNPPLPVLIYLHGGAFVAGDLDTEHDRCIRFAHSADCAVVAVDYRLAPEHPFPAAAEDCYATLCWAAAGGSEFHLDGGRIAIGGSSAGGTLAATVALMTRDRRGPDLALQMLLYPALDDRMCTQSMRRFVQTPGWTTQDSKHMWRYYLGATVTTGASPYAAPARCEDLRRLAPAYVLTAEFDALRDEGIDYGARLLRAGVSAELHQYPGTFHGFELAAPDAEVSRHALAEQAAALRRAFVLAGARLSCANNRAARS